EIEFEDEDLIEREDVAVTVTHAGYIKRTPLAEYRVQGRGGKGRTGMATREEDFVTHIFVASTHAPLLFFSSTGMAYRLKVWRLPEARIQGRGNELSDFNSVRANGKIAMKLEAGDGIVGVQTCTDEHDVLLTTRDGKCIRFALTDLRIFKGRQSTGVRGIKRVNGDEVVSLALLHHVDVSVPEARAYLKQATAVRRALTGEDSEETP